jgi:hypothetical protein
MKLLQQLYKIRILRSDNPDKGYYHLRSFSGASPMAVRLKIPAVVEKPLIPAETRPQKIAQFIHGLPMANPAEAATLLLEELKNMNRQAVAPDVRLKALEIYRPAVINLADHLASQYGNAPLPLPATARKAANIAESLWQELGYGYKLALIDQQSRLFNLASKKSVAFIVYRAIEALNQLAIVHYQTYIAPPGNLWSDLHQLYLYAIQQALHDISIEADDTFNETVSVDLAYKRAMLMPLADPQHLTSNDIQQVVDYINRFARHAELKGIGQLENPAGIFVIRLDTDKPPVPYIKNSDQADAETDILLITVDLARLIHQHLQMLRSGNPPSNSGLPANATDPRYQTMLTYLIQHWGVSPKRVFSRSRKNDVVELGIGLNAAHYFLNGEQHYAPPTDESEIAMDGDFTRITGSRNHRASRWQVLNISAGGMALRKLPAVEETVRVGELLSVRNEKEARWSVGVLRWANNGAEQLEVGAQLIAPEASAAGARPVDKQKFEPVLVLPGITALKQQPSIVARNGLYSPARVLELHEMGKVSRIMVTKLVERTNSFERFQFSYL